MRFLILVTLVGCATIRKPSDPEDPPVVTYVGTAEGAALLIQAQDTRPYDLAEDAMEKGMTTSLQKTDDSVSFSAGSSYQNVQGQGGYAPADVVSTPNGWYAPTGAGSSLPTLGTTVVASVPTDAAGSKIVECPKAREPETVAEQAAFADAEVARALAAIEQAKANQKGKSSH